MERETRDENQGIDSRLSFLVPFVFSFCATATAVRGGLQSWLVQCGQRVAAASIVMRKNWQIFVAGAAAAGSGLMEALAMRQATRPTMRKLMSAAARWPMPKAKGPACHL